MFWAILQKGEVMARVKKEKTTQTVEHSAGNRDELVDSLSCILNKDFKDLGKIAYNLSEDDDPSTVKDWVSTGSSLLNLAISNKKNGGLPCGRITELAGLESSGKSLVAAYALKSTQDSGGVAVLIDTESAISKEFLGVIGVDLKKLMYIPLQTIEDIFQAMETIICNVRKQNKDRLVTIIVDSLAAASTKDEIEDTYDLTGFATKKAILLSKAFRKITYLISDQKICVLITNQLREKVGVMTIGDDNKYTSAGGKALGYHASVRIRLKSVGQIRDAKKETIGIQTQAKIMKNRLGPPYRKAQFNLFFDRGIDDVSSWIDFMSERGLLKNAKASVVSADLKRKKSEDEERIKCFAFTMSTGEVVTFEKKTLHALVAERSDVKDELYNSIAEEFIMKYRSTVDDVVDLDIDTNEPPAE